MSANWRRRILLGSVIASVAYPTAGEARRLSPVAKFPYRLAKYGNCSRCSCPSFLGSSYTCSRRGCGHHYDDHW
jgi:hypothetical protein